MQTPIESIVLETETILQRPIRELVLEGHHSAGWTAAADLVPMLCRQQPRMHDNIDNDTKPRARDEHEHIANTTAVAVAATAPMQSTVGSQIQSLSVSRDHSCFAGLFQGLADNAARIQLQTLQVPNMQNEQNVAALAHCIDKVSSLCRLEFDGHFLDDKGDLPLAIGVCLKENGHVQSVSTNVQSKSLVRAYCERNRFLEQLLVEASAASRNKSESVASWPAGRHHSDSTSFAKRTHSEMEGTSDKANESRGGTSTSSSKKHKPSKHSLLLPPLFMAAMQTPALQLSKLTGTLLRLQESIVPTTNSEKKVAVEMTSK